MITGEILKLINLKLKSIIRHLILIGLLFFLLAVAILFYPQILTVLFIITFFVVAFSAFLIATKISHIKKIFNDILLFVPKKKKIRKKK